MQRLLLEAHQGPSGTTGQTEDMLSGPGEGFKALARTAGQSIKHHLQSGAKPDMGCPGASTRVPWAVGGRGETVAGSAGQNCHCLEESQ